jgi:hypothetical protein
VTGRSIHPTENSISQKRIEFRARAAYNTLRLPAEMGRQARRSVQDLFAHARQAPGRKILAVTASVSPGPSVCDSAAPTARCVRAESRSSRTSYTRSESRNAARNHARRLATGRRRTTQNGPSGKCKMLKTVMNRGCKSRRGGFLNQCEPATREDRWGRRRYPSRSMRKSSGGGF